MPKPVVTHKSLLLKKKALLHHKAASIHAFAPRLINLGGQSLSNKVNLAGDQVVSVGDSLKKIGDRIQDKAIAIKAATGLLAAKFTTARPAPCKTYVAQQQEQVQQQQHEIEPQQRQDLELQQHEAETQQQQQQSFVRRRRQINPNKKQHSELQRLLRLVRQNKAEGCLQRVLCELSVDNNVHGPEGLKFGEAIK